MNQKTEAAAQRIADAMTAAMARRDAHDFAKDYAEDIVVWHNNDRRQQNKAENIASLSYVMGLFDTLEYVDVRRSFTDSGLVQQHVLQGVLSGGRSVEIPACLILEILDGKIKRIDEYLDPAPMLAALEPET